MSSPTLSPVQAEDLLDFCSFLVTNLSQSRTPEAWAQAFCHDWGAPHPNYGFMLRDDGRIVGGIGAIYAERMIRGAPERFCNITSWCVLEAYRSQSMRLAMAVVGQPGYHFTDLTPTEVVSRTLQFLKFKPMNERQAIWPNLPGPFAAIARTHVLTAPECIEAALSSSDAKVFRDHRQFPSLRHAAIGRPGAFCHVVWKKTSLKGLRGARVLAFSDGELFLKHRFALGMHLLVRGCLFTQVESRLLPHVPRGSHELVGFRNKVFRSASLTEADISNLYSEIVALDL